MGSMGSMEPINFQVRVLEPINVLGYSLERWNVYDEMRYFQQLKMFGTHQCQTLTEPLIHIYKIQQHVI